jgi:hypothetical protein
MLKSQMKTMLNHFLDIKGIVPFGFITQGHTVKPNLLCGNIEVMMALKALPQQEFQKCYTGMLAMKSFL